MSPKFIGATFALLCTTGLAANPAAPPDSFSAFLESSPARAILSSTVVFHVTGKGIVNAELVPQFSYGPLFSRFDVAPDGSSATLRLDTTQYRDGRLIPMRILVFNRPAGDVTASEIEVLPARTFYIRNTGTSCETYDTFNHTVDGFPALINGTRTTPRYCEPDTWVNGVQPPDCECALYKAQ